MTSVLISLDSNWILIILLQLGVNLYMLRLFWTRKDEIFSRVLIKFIKDHRQSLIAIGKSMIQEQLSPQKGGIGMDIGGMVQQWLFGGEKKGKSIWG